MRYQPRRLILAAGLSLLFFLGVPALDLSGLETSGTGIGLAVSQARADAVGRRVARRTARRTSRRVARRHAYYNALPRGCVWRAPYHFCGGIYYQPRVIDGRTVYIIVNP